MTALAILLAAVVAAQWFAILWLADERKRLRAELNKAECARDTAVGKGVWWQQRAVWLTNERIREQQRGPGAGRTEG